jgi:hypothetical protein
MAESIDPMSELAPASPSAGTLRLPRPINHPRLFPGLFHHDIRGQTTCTSVSSLQFKSGFSSRPRTTAFVQES